MHEILIISGKGGTGKTSLTAAFAHLSQDTVLCDLDVDAPDLHLILKPTSSPKEPFISGFEPLIKEAQCTQCGTCEQMCRFQAVRSKNGVMAIDPIRCEGCGVCVHFCPAKAIEFNPRQCGEWSVSQTRFGPLVHAQLYPGEENSGKLVALLRTEAKKIAKADGARMILSDGPPGIGCPVISALTGTTLAVMVTEPTPSGIHDLERVVELSGHFKVPAAVILNKSDLNAKVAGEIRSFCDIQNLPILAEIEHDTNFVQAMVQGMAITEYVDTQISQSLKAAWQEILSLIH